MSGLHNQEDLGVRKSRKTEKKKKKKRKKNDPFSIVSCSSSNRDNIYVPLLYGDSNLV
jgi:hypothetical protein